MSQLSRIVLVKGSANKRSCYYVTFFSRILAMPIPKTIPDDAITLHISAPQWILQKKTTYRKFSKSLEPSIFVVDMLLSPWNMTGGSTARLLTRLSTFKAMRKPLTSILRLRGFAQSYDKASYLILKGVNSWALCINVLTLIPFWISNYIHNKVWGEITNPFANFNGGAIDVLEGIYNFNPLFIGHEVTYPCWD